MRAQHEQVDNQDKLSTVDNTKHAAQLENNNEKMNQPLDDLLS